MPTDPPSSYEQAQPELATWHATHPDATFYDMEKAVELQIERLRRIAERALARYPISPLRTSLLHHSFNTTYRVTAADGRRYVLHVLRPMDANLPAAQRLARVESELWWLDRLRGDLHLVVPGPVPAAEGQGAVMVEGEGGEADRVCALFHWVEGRFTRRPTPRQMESVGRVMARLHTHSSTLAVTAWFDRPRVDVADEAMEDEVVRLFTDRVSAEAAGMMAQVLHRTREAQRMLGGGPDTFGLIHADIHQRNYLFQSGEVRLIDFGDCGWGHYLYDFAVTLSELRGMPRHGELRAALLAGYRQVRALPSSHGALIDTFIMLREMQNLSWFVSDQDDPLYRPKPEQIESSMGVVRSLLEAT